MASLNTFGAVFTFAIELEAQLSAYYSDIGDAGMAKAADKRRVKLERVRRENVVEITLEPIEGLSADDYALDLSDNSADGRAGGGANRESVLPRRGAEDQRARGAAGA